MQKRFDTFDLQYMIIINNTIYITDIVPFNSLVYLWLTRRKHVTIDPYLLNRTSTILTNSSQRDSFNPLRRLTRMVGLIAFGSPDKYVIAPMSITVIYTHLLSFRHRE